MNLIADYIKVVDNVLSDSLCEKIIYEFGENEWAEGLVKDGVNSDERKVCTIGISLEDVIARNRETRASIDKEIFIGAGNAMVSYLNLYPATNVSMDTGYELLRYKEGQYYKKHTDSFKEAPRVVSCSFALNNDYEGGEFAFFDRSLTLRIPKGSAILFPSNFMYPHEILPVTKGTRYSIITWFL